MQSLTNLGNSSRPRQFATGLILLLCLLSLALINGQDRQHGTSVVRIKVNNVDKGTGFLFESANQVVTALHVVAGAGDITVFSEISGKTAGATISKVHKPSDLALLTLNGSLGVNGLEYNPTPDLNREYIIWGYPRDVATMQGDPIRFSRSMHRSPTLSSILKVGDKIRTGLKNQGYPSPDVSIFRIGSNIQPGHSGAPILDSDGKVIAVADGGLYGGTARINWAIPASYLPKLKSEGISSSDPDFPRAPSLQAALFSNAAPGPESTGQVDFGNNESLVLVRTAPLSEIYEYLDHDAQLDLDDIRRFAREDAGVDLFSYRIDVYEDFRTGATVSVPSGIAMEYDNEARLLEAWSENEKIEMVIQILENESWTDGLKTKDSFDDYIMTWTDEEGYPIQWESDPHFPDEPGVEDPDEGFYYQEKSRVAHDDYNEIHSEMFASLILDESDFLGTAVIAHDLPGLTPRDHAIYYLMEVCVQLADFTID